MGRSAEDYLKQDQGYEYFKKGDNDRAITEFEAIIRTNPNDEVASIARQQVERIRKERG